MWNRNSNCDKNPWKKKRNSAQAPAFSRNKASRKKSLDLELEEFADQKATISYYTAYPTELTNHVLMVL